jgi:hypothetical protein
VELAEALQAVGPERWQDVEPLSLA